MIEFDFTDTDGWADWVASKLPYVGDKGFGACAAIGMLMNNRPVAGVVYHNYSPLRPGQHVIEMSIATTTPRWASRRSIGTFFAYPFKQLECGVVITRTPRSYKAARKFQLRCGFKLDGVIRRGFGDQDAFVFTMLREEASKWIGVK